MMQAKKQDGKTDVVEIQITIAPFEAQALAPARNFLAQEQTHIPNVVK